MELSNGHCDEMSGRHDSVRSKPLDPGKNTMKLSNAEDECIHIRAIYYFIFRKIVILNIKTI